ncbi:MAG TPA: pitrilysin family protein [Bryobacteraceae bacterium]|jgi:zinc protease
MRRALLLSLTIFAAGLFAQKVPDYKALKYPPLRQVAPPVPISFTLPNGIRVFMLEDHELPLISGSALVRTGNLFDPRDKKGLADLTGSIMRSGGTHAKSGDEIDDDLESIAASVESSIGESSGGVSFNCLKENADHVLGIFKDVLTNPEFRKDKVELAKTQALSGISRRNDDAGGIAAREFANMIYGRDTPWGWTIEYDDINRIHREDMVAFHKRYFFPKNVILSVYGDFSAAEMRAKLERLLGTWNAVEPEVPPFPPVEKVWHPGIWLGERDDVTQTFFEIGHLGGLLNDPEYPALEVAGDILGSGFSSRLVEKVRTQLGYAYAISASWGAGYRSPGGFEISGSTKSATTTDTIRVIREEVEKMRTAEVTPDELRIAKDAVLNSFVFSFDRPSKTLNRLVVYAYFGYPADFLNQYQKAVDKVTAADVLRVAKERFHPEEFTIVAVGNPKAFGTMPLSELKVPVNKLDLTIPPPSPETPPATAAVVAGLESKEKGLAILGRAQVAMGGLDHLRAVKDLDTSTDIKFQMGSSMASGKQHALRIFPDVLRQDQELPFGKVDVYSDGKTGWILSPQGVTALTPPVAQQIRQEMFRNMISLAISNTVPGRTVNAIDDNTVEITNSEGDKARVAMDPATGLPSKISYMTTPIRGAPVQVVETYTAWKAVNEVMLPFEYEIEQAGKKFAEGKITSYRINSGLKLEDLSKKP